MNWKFLERTYCINLANRVDRWEQCEKEFKRWGITDVIRFDAIKQKIPHVGFNQSQIECLKLCVGASKPCMILEDDFKFNSTIKNLESIMESLPNDWEVLYLGGIVFTENYEGTLYSPNLGTAKNVLCTHAMIYNVGVPEKIVRMFNKPAIYLHRFNIYDEWLRKNIQPTGKAFITIPMMSYQHASYSDLSNQASVGHNWFDLTDTKLLRMDWFNIPNWFNFQQIYDRAVSRGTDGDVFIELGSWYGASTVYLAKKIKQSGKKIKVIAVDLWKQDEQNDHNKYFPKNDIYDMFQYNLMMCGVSDIVTPMKMSTTEAFSILKKKKIKPAFVFVDACHLYECVKEDVRNYSTLLSKEGWMAGHDVYFPDVARAVKEELGKSGQLKLGNICWEYKS